MSIFLKAGYWKDKAKGYKEEFNLDLYVRDLISTTPGNTAVSTATADIATESPLTLTANDFTPALTKSPKIKLTIKNVLLIINILKIKVIHLRIYEMER